MPRTKAQMKPAPTVIFGPQVSTDYTDEHAFRAWAASEITSRALCRLACGTPA
jgi:hypothetical protein